MILDANKGDRGRVWLDGAEVTASCCYADDEKGIVTLYKKDASGMLIINRMRDSIEVEKRNGVVTLKRLE